MPYNAGNRKDVRTLEKEAKQQEKQRHEIVKGIMSVAAGREWMHNLLEHCHCFATSYSDVSNRMAFMEGQREVGILLLTNIMAACPDNYILMMGEANARRSSIDARLDRKDSNGGDSGSGPDDDTSGSGDDDAAGDLYTDTR